MHDIISNFNKHHEHNDIILGKQAKRKWFKYDPSWQRLKVCSVELVKYTTLDPHYCYIWQPNPVPAHGIGIALINQPNNRQLTQTAMKYLHILDIWIKLNLLRHIKAKVMITIFIL